jgi:hypothetical protein
MAIAAQNMVMRTLKENPDPCRLGMLHMHTKLPEKSQPIPLFLSTHRKRNSRNDQRTRHGMAEVV